jgi:hypothetical protein
MEEGGQRHAPAALPPGKTLYPLYGRLGGPQGMCRRLRKISPSPGFDPLTVQPVASRLTEWPIPARYFGYWIMNRKGYLVNRPWKRTETLSGESD